jgi:hypothetical protein
MSRLLPDAPTASVDAAEWAPFADGHSLAERALPG